jgi:hypothetical protein
MCMTQLNLLLASHGEYSIFYTAQRRPRREICKQSPKDAASASNCESNTNCSVRCQVNTFRRAISCLTVDSYRRADCLWLSINTCGFNGNRIPHHLLLSTWRIFRQTKKFWKVVNQSSIGCRPGIKAKVFPE